MRIGIDLGGTKIAGIALGDDGEASRIHRLPTPRNDYGATLRAIGEMVDGLASGFAANGETVTVGIGIPGSLSPRTGLVRNANSVWLNGRSLQNDLEQVLGRPVRLANDANCFALSEARDGAATTARTVFGVILGTGCGGGLVVDGALVDGAHAVAGEWGHTPLPWPTPDEYPGAECWCGRRGCIETWVSGPAVSADHHRATGERLTAEEIAARAAHDPAAEATLARLEDRLGRALGMITSIFDPDAIVLGGGLSRIGRLYETLPGHIAPHVFSDFATPNILRPRHGDDSGVRGAAWLWPAGSARAPAKAIGDKAAAS